MHDFSLCVAAFGFLMVRFDDEHSVYGSSHVELEQRQFQFLDSFIIRLLPPVV